MVIANVSGLFGHIVTAENLIEDEGRAKASGTSATQGAAHLLHAIVIIALLAAGVAAYSLAKSSLFGRESGAVGLLSEEIIILAMYLGLTPILFYYVAMDRALGASILSTESLYIGLERSRACLRLNSVLWMGNTDGVLVW